MSKIDTIKAEDLNKFVSYTNGDFFCGNLAYGQREGQGVYMAFSGDKYMGTWKDDQPNGFGVMDQKTYLLEGDFKKGKAEGWGRMLVKEQEKDIQCYSLQCGHFHNDKLHGYGRILSKTEGLTEGCFLNGILEGPGIQTYTKGDFFVGQFANGKKNGIGMYFYYNGGYYIGQFKDDSKSGYGYLIDKHDCYYSGSWKNDAKNGAGFEVYRDGSKYKGFFNGNNKEGSGIMLYTQGIKYMGKWKNNKMHGFGRLDQKNIHPACGMYENGVLIKAQDVFLKEVIAEVDRAFVPDDFDHWISLSPDIKSSYLDSFICHEEDLEMADKYIYPEFLNQSHI